MKFTIKDIAQKSGVSAATVSKVLNNKMYVAADTRERVLATIKQMNYAPNAAAANLARQSSKCIFYADSFYKGLPYQNPHMFDIICGVSNELSRKGYQLSLLNMSQSGQEPEEILKRAILSHSADGIILNSVFVTPSIERLLLDFDFPQICIGAPSFDSILSWIDTNHTLSSNIAVEHLLSCGCKRLAFMGGQKKDAIFASRLQGFQIAMEKNHQPVRTEYIVYNEPEAASIYSSALQLLSLPLPPDAIICTNSLMAVGTVQAIHSKGLSIPDQISLIAFDDYPYSPTIFPSPTVIDIDLFSLGVNAGNFMLKKIKDPAMLIQTYTALPRLIQRQTTKPL